MLAYTLNKLLEVQAAMIERNMASVDEFGADPEADWQPLGDPVPCRFYWRKQNSRGPAKEYAVAQRTVALTEGGMILPPDTEITDHNDLNGDQDRIAAVIAVADPDGDPSLDGPLYVTGVFRYGDHTEISWISP